MKNKNLFFLISFLVLVGCSSNSGGPNVNVDAAVALSLSPDSDIVLAGFCSKANIVQSVDLAGNPTPNTIEQIIKLTSSSNSSDVSFYSDASCTTKVASVKIEAGQTKSSFYFKKVKSEYVALTVAAANLKADTQSKTVISPFASALQITADSTFTAGKCSSPVTVTALNYRGEVSNVTDPLQVMLTGNSIGKYYLTADCSDSPITSVTIPTNFSRQIYYYKANKIGTYILGVTADGPIVAKTQVSVTPNSATQLLFNTAPQYVDAGTCSAQYNVQVEDAFGNPAPQATDFPVALSGNAVKFYSDVTCSTAVTSMNLPAGRTILNFYTISNLVGTVDISVKNAAFSSSQTLTVNSSRPTHLALSILPNTFIAGAAFPKITVQVKDKFENIVPTSNNTILIAAYSDAACTILSSKTLDGFPQVSAVAGIAAFSALSYSKSETIYVGARSNSLTGACSPQISVTPQFASTLAITGPLGITAGQCAPYSMDTVDSYGNISAVGSSTGLTFASAGSAQVYNDSMCSNPAVTSLNIPAGQSHGTFYLKDTKLEKIAFTVVGLGTAGVVQNITVSAGFASRLIVNSPGEGVAGKCSSAFLFKIQDVFSNETNATQDYPISITENVGSGFFYIDSACSTKIGAVTIPTGSSSKVLYYKSNLAESTSVSVQGVSSTLPLSFNIVAAPASKLAISNPNGLLVGDLMTKIIVKALDSNGNLSNNNTLPVTLFAYKDSSCSTPSSIALNGTISKVLVNGVVIFGEAKYTKSEVIYLSATADGLTATCSSAIKVSSSAPTTLALQGPDVFQAGQCSQLTITTVDDFTNTVPVTSDGVISLSGGVHGSFYTSSDCSGTAITSIPLTMGSYFTQVYYANTTAEPIALTAALSPYKNGIITSRVSPLAPKQLVITGPANLSVAACSSVIQIQAKDVYNNPSPVSFDTGLILSATGSANFYSDSTCGGTISTAKIGVNTSSVSIYLKDNTAESLTVQATTPSLSLGNLNLSVGAIAPTIVTLNSSAGKVYAGSCSPVLKLETRDAFNNISSVNSNTSINLSNFGNGKFYNTNDCSGAAITSAAVLSGQSSVNVYFLDTKAESLNISMAAFSGTSLAALNISPAPISQVVISSDPKSILAGSCSGAIVVQAEDKNGNYTKALADLSMALSGPGVTFYGNSGCSGAPITSSTITAGNSFTTIYAYATSTSATLITATGPSVANQVFSVTAGTPSKLGFNNPPASGIPGTASFSTPIVIQVQDQYSNLIPSATNPVSILTYKDAACTVSPATSLSGTLSKPAIAGNAAFGDLGYNTAETIYMGSNSAGLTSSCSPAIQIKAGSPSQIVVAGNSTATAGNCMGPFSVTAEDSFGNPSNITAATNVAFSGLGTGLMYSTTDCSGTGISGILPMSAGTSAKSFYYKTQSAGNLTLSATSSLGNTTFPMNVIPNSAAKLLVAGPTNVIISQCSDPFTLRVTDAYSNNTPVTMDTAFTLSGKLSGSFYTDSLCTNLTDSLTIRNGQSSATFYYKNLTIGQSTTLVSNYPGFTSVGTTITIVSPPPASMSISGDNVIASGWCSPYNLQLLDKNQAAAVNSSVTSITLGGNGAGLFYSDAACSTPVNFLTISAQTNSKSFYYLASSSQVVNFSADSTGLPTAFFGLTVKAGVPASIGLVSTPSLNTTAGAAFTVSAVYLDKFGNKSYVDPGNPLVLTLENADKTSSSNLNANGASLSVEIDPSTYLSTYAGLTINKTGSYHLVASGSSLVARSSNFSIIAGAPATIAKTSGDNQFTMVNLALAGQLVGTVLDSYSNVVPGINVTFNANGTGSVSPTSASSDTAGLVKTQFTAGSTKFGPQKIRFLVPSVSTVFSDFNVNILTVSALALSGPNTMNKGVCSGPYSVTTLDQTNTAVSSIIDTNITLGASTGANNVQYFSDSACSLPITAIAVKANTAASQFYSLNSGGSGFQMTALALNVIPVTMTITSRSIHFSGNINYGTVNINVDTIIYVYNDGDVFTMGALSYTGEGFSNGWFQVINDSCSGVSFTNGAACPITIRFIGGQCGMPNGANTSGAISVPGFANVASVYGNTSYNWQENSNTQIPDWNGGTCGGLNQYWVNYTLTTGAASGACAQKCNSYSWYEEGPMQIKSSNVSTSCGTAYCCLHGDTCQ